MAMVMIGILVLLGVQLIGQIGYKLYTMIKD